VLQLPCGRSAHLEAGWFAGRGKPVIILLHDGGDDWLDPGLVQPELMYKMATAIVAQPVDVAFALIDVETQKEGGGDV
jgi:hypothetical protein